MKKLLIKLDQRDIKHLTDEKGTYYQFKIFPKRYYASPISQIVQRNKALDDKLRYLWKIELDHQSCSLCINDD